MASGVADDLVAAFRAHPATTGLARRHGVTFHSERVDIVGVVQPLTRASTQRGREEHGESGGPHEAIVAPQIPEPFGARVIGGAEFERQMPSLAAFVGSGTTAMWSELRRGTGAS